MNPAALIASNVAGTTGALFQLPSVGRASSVFPKFHPGLSAAKAADALIGVKVPVQTAPEVALAEVALAEVDLTELALVTSVVADDTTELAVPGRH